MSVLLENLSHIAVEGASSAIPYDVAVIIVTDDDYSAPPPRKQSNDSVEHRLDICVDMYSLAAPNPLLHSHVL